MTTIEALRPAVAESNPIRNTEELACNLRDTLLPDILAVSMLLKEVNRRVEPDALDAETRDLLSEMQATLEGDVTQVRSLIARLSRTSEQDANALPDLRNLN